MLLVHEHRAVWSHLLARLRGDSRRLPVDVVAQLRAKYPRRLP
jgi:hypothetical protein